MSVLKCVCVHVCSIYLCTGSPCACYILYLCSATSLLGCSFLCVFIVFLGSVFMCVRACVCVVQRKVIATCNMLSHLSYQVSHMWSDILCVS